MPSGKRAREQRREATGGARTPPPVRSKSGGVRPARRASPRALAIGGGVVALAAIAIVLTIVLGGSSSSKSMPTAADLESLPNIGSASSPTALAGAAEANDLFKGIPQKGLVLGKPSAPVEMEMFIDVQCPVCQNYEVNYLPTIVNKYIKTGRVQLHLQPWAFLGPQSFTGRLGVIAASFQNKGFEYAKVLYDNQGPEESGWLSGKEMAFIAASVSGLNLQKWLTATNGPEVKQIASAVDTLAQKGKVTGTPTVWVGPAGGKLHDIVPAGAAPTLQDTEKALDQALRGA